MKKKYSIVIDGVSFRWDGEQLVITSQIGQFAIQDAATLLDFLQELQEELSGAEQQQDLPRWTHQKRHTLQEIHERQYLPPGEQASYEE